MAVRIRMKKMGRTHRPFYRVCAMDQRSPRDGRVIEELGYYDPMCPETDARVVLKADRIDYWIGVGAQPSEKVGVLIKKYGTNGTHLDAQQAAMERLGKRKQYTPAPVAPTPAKTEPAPAEAPTAEAPTAEAPTSEAPTSEAPTAAETPSEPESKAEDTAVAEPAPEAVASSEAATAEEPKEQPAGE